MIQQRVRTHLKNKWRAYAVVIAVMGGLGFGLRNVINRDAITDNLPEGAYTLTPSLTIPEIGGGGEVVWVTVIRNNEPVWVRLDGVIIVQPEQTPIPTSSAVIPSSAPTRVITLSPGPTAQV